MGALARVIGYVSKVSGAAAAAAALGLIAVTMIEVISRYALRAPTVWAFDLAYMLNGAAFVLACALALERNQHVAVDIFSQAFSPRARRLIEVAVFALLLLPALGLVCHAAWSEAWKAWVTGEIEQVSPWQPRIWPFRLVLAIGLSALWLQVLGRVLRPAAAEPAH